MHHNQTTGLLAALQLADSFFPTGAYAHSLGLEGMVRQGWVSNAHDVEDFIRNQITWSVVPADCVALSNSHHATEAADLDMIVAIDRLLYAMKLPSELRTASCHTGRRLLSETAPLVTNETHTAYHARVASSQTPGNNGVALGVTTSAMGIPKELALAMFCHSYSVGILGAAMRQLPIAHTQAQGILHRLHPLVESLAREIEGRPWTDMTTFTPELELAAVAHESDDIRIFAS